MSEPTLSMAEAARACGVSVSTMRRHREELEAFGATRHGTSWVIPISALVAIGLMPRVTPPDPSSSNGLKPFMTPTPDGSLKPPDASLWEENNQLKQRLAEAERRAAVLEVEKQAAEMVAQERERIIQSQERSLRLLEAPTPPTEPNTPTPAPQEQPPPAPVQKKRGWWPFTTKH